MHWLLLIIGVTNASGPWYLFWSGIVGDAFLIGVGVTMYHKHNCHEDGCHRIGKHIVDGTPWCNHHHEQARGRLDSPKT